MANWSNPVLTSTYTNFMNELKDRDTDLALMFDGTTSSNLSTGTIRWDSTAGRWKKWNGSSWAELAATYALTALSTTGNATIGGTLSVTGSTALAAATATTPATADNNTNVATTAFVKAQNYAPLASPTLTGTPAAPTATTGTNTTQIATTAFVNAEIANDALLKSGGTMTGAITLSGDPTADLHAVPRQWVESLASKQSCRVATTANITLSGTQTVDGIALSIGDRVLVKNQTTTSQNGIYLVASGAWTRATDGDTWNDLVGAYTTVEQGTANVDSMWLCEIARGGTLGTTAVTWQLISNEQVAALGTLGTTGLIARTAANTVAARSIAVSGTGLSVTNADGVSGNPTVTSNATSANTASAIVARDGSGNFTAGTLTLTSFSYTGNPTSSSTGAFAIPSGTTAQRPTAAQGQIRYNTSLSQFEGYTGSTWFTIAGGSTLRLLGSTSGYVELAAPAAAGSITLVLPTNDGSSGQFLQTNGSGTLSWGSVSASGSLIRAPQILTSGTSYTTPSNCTAIYVEAVGGGGGGGGTVGAGAGGGGGGGGYCAKYFTVSSATAYTYAIGAGGAFGGNGGNTTFTVGATTITASGGLGGGLESSGGSGGSGTNGDINMRGGGGGGGGTSGTVASGAGGSSFFGGGAIGLANTAGTGTAGENGGGGGGSLSTGANFFGSSGGNGLIRIWEYT